MSTSQIPAQGGVTTDHDLLVRIDAKTDMLIGQSADHEARLRKLEGFTARQVGAAAGVSAVVSAIMALVAGRI